MIRLSIEALTDAGAFMDQWRALHARAGAAPFFLSPAWIDAWLAGKPPYVDLFTIKGALDSETVLLGVIGRSRKRRLPLLGARAALLHEFGLSSFDAIYIESNDFLLAEKAPAGARQGAVEALVDAFAGEDDVVFRNVRTHLARAIADAVDTGKRRLVTLNRQPTFDVDLSAVAAGGEDYIASLSGSLGGQLRRALRRYQERGPLAFDIAASETAREAAWNSLAALHEEGWSRRGRRGVFSNPDFVAFHRRLMTEAPDKVHLVTISCGGENIACLYNLVEGERVMNYQSGFRFEDDNQLKPGFLAHALAIGHYAALGYDAYDLLAGEAAYKRRLASERETLQTVVLEKRSGMRAQLRRFVRSLKSAAKTRRT